MGKYICQRPIHPGELLKEETEERKLSQCRLAEQMGISYKVLNDILNCRRPITADYYADSDALRGSFGYQCFATDADAA